MSEIPIHTLTIEHAKADEPFCTLGKHDFVLYADHLKELEGLREENRLLNLGQKEWNRMYDEAMAHSCRLCGFNQGDIQEDGRCLICTVEERTEADAVPMLRAQIHNLKSPAHSICNENLTETLTAALEATQRANKAESELDALRAQLRSKDEQLAGMKEALEPVTDEEMWAFSLHQIDVVQPYRKLPVLTLSQVNKLFASRLSGPSPAQEGTCKTS